MCEHTGGADTKDYRVGTGQPGDYASIGAVPWESLDAGDTVRIFYREQPYAEKIYLLRSGTAAQPIRVCGVASAAGKLPVITGKDATTRAELVPIIAAKPGELSAFENLGVVTIIARLFDEQVAYVQVEGLNITGTLVGDTTDKLNKFRDSRGAQFDWDERSGCIRMKRAAHVVIRGNEISNCGYGIFTASTAENNQHIVRDLLVDGNYFHDNGLRDSDQRHQTYLQGVDVTVQYNYFGPTRHGNSGGNHLKTRVAGLIARYNYFDNAPNAHLIDIVEVEEYRSYIMPWRHRERVAILLARDEFNQTLADAADALQVADWAKYQNVYIYGNLIHLHGTAAPSGPIHYGFDNTALDRQPGALWFYNNTFLFEANSGKSASLVYYGADTGDGAKYGPYTMNTLNFDLPTDPDAIADELHYLSTNDHDFMDGDGEDDGNICEAVSATCLDRGKMLQNKQQDYGRIKAYNNAIVVLPLSGTQKGTLRLTRYKWDMLELNGGNWINTAAQFGNTDIDDEFVWPEGNAQHHVTGADSLILGTASPIVRGTFEPLSGSELLDKAVALPAELQALRPEWQVVRDPAKPGKLTRTPRTTVKTIGAIETASSSTDPGPGAGS